MNAIKINVDEHEDWGELNETNGSRQERIRLSQLRRNQDNTALGSQFDRSNQLNEEEFENLLNEAII